MKTPPRGGASLLTYRVALAVLLTTLLVTTLLLAGLLLTTLLLLTGLRLSAALLATLLLTTLLLLAGLLVRVLVLIHFTLQHGWKRSDHARSVTGNNARVRIFVPIKQRPIRGKAYRNLARPEVFPFKQEENRRWDDICCSGCSAFRSLFWC